MGSINLQDGEQARLTITKEQENEISKLYRQVYLDLKKEMDTLSPGRSTSETLRSTYLNKMIKELKEAYQSLGVGLEKQIQKGIESTASSMVQSNIDWMSKVGLNVEGAYSYVPKDIVALLSTGKLYGGGWSLSKAIWGESQKHAADIDKIVAAGVAANKSAYDIAKSLEQYVNPSAKKGWDWSKVYPGTSKKVDYNAQRLARTMVSHAYQQSLLASTKYNPFVKGYRWRSAHTHRTCELCNERDGQVYSANDLPLDHPNGLCTFLAELTGSMTSIADRLGDWVQGTPDPEIDNWFSKMGGSLQIDPKLNTQGFKSLSEDEFKEWQKKNGTLNQVYSDFEKKWGVKLRDGVLPSDQDRFIEEEGEWLYDLLNKARENYVLATSSTQNRYSYVQNADWSKNINQYWRTGDSSFLRGTPRGKITKKMVEQRYQEDISGIRKTSKALDSLIESTQIDMNLTVDRWGGINSLSSLGISSNLSTGRIGHSFVTEGLNLEEVKKQVDNLIGTTMVDKGYMSASVSSSLNVFQGSDIKFTINVPKGTHAFITDNLQESEVIFARGTKTEITGSRIIETEALDTWTQEKVKTKTLEIFMNLIP